MRSLLSPGLALVLVAAVLAAGCGGGGASRVPHAGSGVASKGNYTVKIAIPTTGSGTGSTTRRKPKYISASLASIVVQILGSRNQQLVQGDDYLNITDTGTASNGDCSVGIASITCTMTLSAAIGTGGTFTVVVAMYDAQQTASCTPGGTPACSGNLLSISNVPQDVTAGQTLSIALGGIPAYLQPLELVSGYVSGVQGTLVLYGPGPQQVKFSFLDADKNMIVGPGAPTLSVTSANTSVLQASVATTAGSGIYTLTFNPQTVTTLGVPVVQATTAPVQFTASIPNSTLSISVTEPFIIKHSVMYVAANNPSNSGTTTIFAYFDGNTTPSWNVYDTGYVVYIATDMNGNVWGADYSNAKIVEFDGNANAAPNENDPALVLNYRPDFMAFDQNGNAYVANYGSCCAQATTFDEFNAPNPQSTPNFTVVGTSYYSNTSAFPYGITVDQIGNVYYSYLIGGTGHIDSVPFGGLTTTGAIGAAGLAVDPISGYLWYAYTGGSAMLLNQNTLSTVNTISNGVFSGLRGMATDQLGNLYVPNFLGSGVVMFAPPSYSTPTTLASALTAAISVAVYPNAIIGQEAQVGVVPPQSPSPTPLPAPSSS